MTDLYGNLANAPIKAEALREAQLAMLRGEVRIENNLLYLAGSEQPIPIPDNLQATIGQDFSNPYFWSAFTAIGSPW
jgi:CHAT domain-containing protein